MKANYANGLYRQYEETQNRLDQMMARLERVEQEHREEICVLNEKHAQEVAELKREIAVRDKKIEELTARNEALEGEVSRLKSIINNDSHNSSNPPSTDQKPSAVNAHNSRKKSDRKRGGQIGRIGKTLTERDVKRILESKECEHKIVSVGKKSDRFVTRYTVDMKVVPVITEYRIYQNKNGKYQIPKELSGVVTYGNALKSFAVALYGIGVVSNDRIAEFIRNMTHNLIQIATGTIYGFCRSFAERATGTLFNIEERLMNQEVIYTDATVVTVNGTQSYVRNISADDAVIYCAMPRKNLEELKKLTILQKHIGVMVHDHETAMYNFGTLHAECNVHILRYLEKNSEDTKNEWSEKMKRFLTTANKARQELMKKGASAFNTVKISEMECEYDRILNEGMEQNKGTKPKWAKKDEMTLLTRLKNYKKNHLLFLHRFDVDFDNNQSERDLRKCKNRQKMAGGFRTADGCAMFCDILSIIETAKRLNQNPFVAIWEILQGKRLFNMAVAGEL